MFFPGEVERLLKEYRQNQELVRRIGGHYYQIIYPVQLRHHEKMGISTREVSPSKVRNPFRYRNKRSSQYSNYTNTNTVCQDIDLRLSFCFMFLKYILFCSVQF